MNHSLSSLLTSRRGAWAVLAIALVLMVALFGLLRGADAPARSTHAPVDSESARVSALLEQFPDADRQSVLVVASRTDGGSLGADDLQALDGLLPTLGEHTAAEPSGPVVSEDGQAALLIAPITVGTDNSKTAQTIDALRTTLADHAIEGVSLQVTGGPAFGADIASAFDGADFTLLAVTILIVAALLILTYRSPVLWLVPLMVIVLADGLTGRVTGRVTVRRGAAVVDYGRVRAWMTLPHRPSIEPSTTALSGGDDGNRHQSLQIWQVDRELHHPYARVDVVQSHRRVHS